MNFRIRLTGRGLAVFLLPVFLVAAVSSLTAQVSDDQQVFVEENFKSGYYFYNRRQYLAALPFFEKAISLSPQDVRSRIWLGQSYFMAGYLRNALTEWQTVLNLGGGGNLLRSKLQYIYYLQGREKKDFDDFQPYLFLKKYQGFQRNKTFFVRPSGIAVDNKNNLYVAGFQSGSVCIMDPNGDVKTRTAAQLGKPFDIAFREDGSFFVSDFEQDAIFLFDKNGSLKKKIGEFGYREGQLAGPEGLYSDAQGHIFVADTGNNRIQKFDSDGEFLMAFGTLGDGEGEFSRPADIVADAQGRLFVSDFGNSRIQVFDPSGNFLYSFGEKQLSEPRGLHLTDNGLLVIADGSKGVVIYRFADSSWHRMENLTGKVSQAISVAVDRNNMIYVADFNSYHVAVFVPEKLKYVNLDLRIIRSQETDFPSVRQFVMVRDREGQAIHGLTRRNFRVYEQGRQVSSVTVTDPYLGQDKVSFVYVADKSLAMEEYQPSQRSVMKNMLEKLPGSDRIEVINANSDRVWISQPYIANVLSPLNGAGQGAYKGRASIGKALYEAITESLKHENRSAVVLFTTGEFVPEDYQPYGLSTCLHYAKNNGVPVYIVAFNRGNDMRRLGVLAEETGGLVYDAVTSNRIYTIRKHIMEQPPYSYALTYNAFAHPDLQGKYRNFTVEVRYKNIFGYDTFGYYVPRE